MHILLHASGDRIHGERDQDDSGRLTKMGEDAEFHYECKLSPEAQEKARKELNENPQTRMLELKAFRDRLLQYPGLRPRTDAAFLIRFLRARKWDQERAFQLIITYYRNRKDHPEVFDGVTPSKLIHLYRAPACSLPYPYPDRKGRYVDFIFPGHSDLSRFSTEDILACYFVDHFKMVEDERYLIYGRTTVFDYRDYSFSKFVSNASLRNKTAKLFEGEFIPNRSQSIIFLNETRLVDAIMAFFKMVLREKHFQRITCLGSDVTKLHDYIDPAYLPAEYGGTLKETMEDIRQRWVKELLSRDKIHEEDNKYGFVDYTIGRETSRGQQNAIANMAGTFKKLNVD